MSASASNPDKPAATGFVVNSARLREHMTAWLASANWSVEELNSALRKTPSSVIASAGRMGRFAQGEDNLSRDEKTVLWKFLRQYPTPGPFEAFFDRLAADVIAQARASEEKLAAMREATEQRRAEHQRYWLSRERAPRTGSLNDNPLFGLTKAEVAALSGVGV